MINKEYQLISKERLLAHLDDKVVLEPPCYKDEIYTIFYSYSHTGFEKSGENPIEKLKKDFPKIKEEDLEKLIVYFKEVTKYCQDVCCDFEGLYQTVIIPKTDEAKRNVQLVVEICTRRYPWLKKSYIENFLERVCWLSNR